MKTTTDVRERPILMSAEMVRARRAGLKTQTRRIVKPQPPERFMSGDVAPITNGRLWAFSRIDAGRKEAWPPGNEPGFACPYGEPGDRLWVREGFWIHPTAILPPNGEPRIFYDADVKTPTTLRESGWAKKPSIHMPHWACRDVATILSVRVERVQDISELDALAEGVLGEEVESVLDGKPGRYVVGSARDSFAALWDRINGAGSWNANPWVWVLELSKFGEESDRGARR